MTKPIKIKNTVLGEGIPKICVPLTGREKEALCEEARAAAAAGADLVEWRADFFGIPDLKEKLEETLETLSGILGKLPLIFTVRTQEEGGQLKISPEDYRTVNLRAARSKKVDFVDVQVFAAEGRSALIEELHEAGTLVIASTHDFEKTDGQEILLERFRHMDETGGDILKMAVMPKTFDDVAAVMLATYTMAGKYTQKPLISMAMGKLGDISRISGENFGSCVTFGTVGAASAPGQFPVKELRTMMEALHRKNAEP